MSCAQNISVTSGNKYDKADMQNYRLLIRVLTTTISGVEITTFDQIGARLIYGAV